PASRWALLLFADKRRRRGAALSRGVGGPELCAATDSARPRPPRQVQHRGGDQAVRPGERGIDFEPLCNLAARAVTNACLTESRRNVTGSFCLWRDGRADSHLRRKQPP